MKEDDIPVKTSRGAMEIKTRELGLAARLRTILLLVDGIRTVRELERLGGASGAGPDALASLLDKGLIALPPPQAQSLEPEMQEQAAPGQPDPVPSRRQRAAPRPASATQAPAPAVPTAPTAPTASAMPSVQTAQAIPSAPTAPEPPPAALRTEPVPAPAASSEGRHPASQEDAPSQEHDPAGTAFLVARAHLAAALDEHLGFGGYALKQKLMDCRSVHELIAYFDEIEERLIAPMGISGATGIIRRAITILQMQ